MNFIEEFCLLFTPTDLIRLGGKRNAQKVRKPTPHTHTFPEKCRSNRKPPRGKRKSIYKNVPSK